MDQGALDKGADITLSSMLKQLLSLPADPRVAENLDLFLFGGNDITDPFSSPSNVPQEDLRAGEILRRFRNSQGSSI